MRQYENPAARYRQYYRRIYVLMKNLLSGISDEIPSLSNGREYRKYEGFSADAANMRGDWEAIGNDMRKVLPAKGNRSKRRKIR